MPSFNGIMLPHWTIYIIPEFTPNNKSNKIADYYKQNPLKQVSPDIKTG